MSGTAADVGPYSIMPLKQITSMANADRKTQMEFVQNRLMAIDERDR